MAVSEPYWQTKLIRELSSEYDVTEEQVRKAVMYQFKFTSNIMSKGEFESVRLPYWGVFRVDPIRLKRVNQYKPKKGNNEQ